MSRPYSARQLDMTPRKGTTKRPFPMKLKVRVRQAKHQAVQEIQPPESGVLPKKLDTVIQWRKNTALTGPAASVENLQSQSIKHARTNLSRQCVLSTAQGHLLKATRSSSTGKSQQAKLQRPSRAQPRACKLEGPQSSKCTMAKSSQGKQCGH